MDQIDLLLEKMMPPGILPANSLATTAQAVRENVTEAEAATMLRHIKSFDAEFGEGAFVALNLKVSEAVMTAVMAQPLEDTLEDAAAMMADAPPPAERMN